MLKELRSKLGGCPKCMGLSLGSVFVFWLLYAVSFVVSQSLRVNPLISDVPLALASGLSGLFLAHMAAFTRRSFNSLNESCTGCDGAAGNEEPPITRRVALRWIGGLLALGVMLSLANIPVVRSQFTFRPCALCASFTFNTVSCIENRNCEGPRDRCVKIPRLCMKVEQVGNNCGFCFGPLGH